jgi:dipeptidyl aminopeptidase/acylaminoacyl peptidase
MSTTIRAVFGTASEGSSGAPRLGPARRVERGVIGFRACAVTAAAVGCLLAPNAFGSRLVALESSDASLPCGDSAGHMNCGTDDRIVTLQSGGGHRHQLARRVTSDGGDRLLRPSWSPDGTRIAFLIGPRPGTMRADGTHRRMVGPGCCFYSVGWARTGKALLLGGSPTESASDGIYELRIAGGHLRRLTHGPDSDPAASSTGAIAFVRTTAGGAGRIYAIRRPGGKPRLVVSGTAPDWAPGGRHLVFERDDGLYTVPAGGGRPKRLTRTAGDRDPAWSPSGSQIAFERFPDLWLVRRDGSHAHRIDTGGDPNAFWEWPSWQR